MQTIRQTQPPKERKAKGGISEDIRQTWRMFTHGDVLTKLSVLILGAGCFLRGQVVKGLLFLGVQALYLYYMIVSGWQYISKLPTLGTAAQVKVFDESIGIYIYKPGDNSMLILLFGVMAIFMTIFYLMMCVKSLRAAFLGQQRAENGEKQPTFRAELRSLLDVNLHKTLLTLPTLSVLLFTVLPLVFMVLMAFTNFDRAHQPPGNLFSWVGFQNFRDIFWENPLKSRTFVSVLGWTLTWAFFATFSCYFFGMILALMINKKGIRFKKFWRTMFVTSIAVPQFVSLLLMFRMLHDLGPVNVLLKQLGIIGEDPIRFLSDGDLARVTIIIVNLWVGVPFTMLSTTGILMNIPEDMYESARIDGAGPVVTFMKITLPHMLFVTSPYLITQFIGNINNFNVIYFLTTGGPLTLDYFQGGKTDLLVTWLYRLTVSEQNYSLASTIGIMIFLISAFFSLILYNRTSSVKRGGDFS